MKTKEYVKLARTSGLGKAQATSRPAAAPTGRPEFKLIGGRTPRVDGEKVVTGQAIFTHDISFENMLCGKILRSPHASAEITALDLTPAKNYPGVKAVLELKRGRVYYAGEPIAAVAAVNEEAAEEALKQIKIEYRVLPHVLTVEQAMAEAAPKVLEAGNIEKIFEYSRGNIEEGFRQAEVVLERTYTTAIEIHHPAETHGSVARWDGEELTVWDSTQAVHGVKAGLARALNIPASNIRVIKNYMGGGFGSKLGLNEYTVTAALLSREARRPVKIILSRKENSMCVGFRPSTRITIKGGAKKDGTLTALSYVNHTCGGVGPGDDSSEPLIDIYRCPNVKAEDFAVYANTCASRPTRAPGHVQGTFALEGFMEELAAELGMDPLELRMKNYSTKNRGDTELVYSSKGLDQCYKLGAEKIGWKTRNRKPGEGRGRKRRGLGMATQIWWGTGVPGTLADVKVGPDGSVEAICGTQDIGGGTRTFMAVVTAETLGLEPQDITVKIGNSDYPWAPVSGGSLTAPSVGPATRDAALKARERLTELAAAKLKINPSDVVVENKKFFDKNNPANSLTFKDAARELRRETPFHGLREAHPESFAYNTFGAHFAEVEVDTEAGEIKVRKVVAVHEIGQVLNRLTAESQVVGGVMQGLSAALFEERVMDDEAGRLVNPNLHDYKIATTKDVPEIVPIFIDMTDPRLNNLGTKGVGEPPRIPIAGAIANAVYNAIGIHLREIPMTPDRVLKALKAKEGRS